MTLELLTAALENLHRTIRTVEAAGNATPNPRTVSRCKTIVRGLKIYQETLENTIQIIQFFEEETYATNDVYAIPAPIEEMLIQEERFQLDELRRARQEE